MNPLAPRAFAAFLGISCLAAVAAPRDGLEPAGAPPHPAPAPVKPVTETLWGREVTDNYRYMEALEPSTLAWIKAQGAYARSVLDAIPARAGMVGLRVGDRRLSSGPGSQEADSNSPRSRRR